MVKSIISYPDKVTNSNQNPNINPNSIPNTNNDRQSQSYGRQELLGTLLNNYTSNFNSFAQPNQSISGSSGNGGIGSISGGLGGVNNLTMNQASNYYIKDSPNINERFRNDSIYLPPPVNSQLKSNDDPAGSGLQNLKVNGLPSRSNSIFNSIVQFPSSHNSISADYLVNRGQKSRESSLLYDNPNLLQDFENYLNNYNNFNNTKYPNSRQNLQDRKPSKSSKNSSIDLSNSVVWDNFGPGYNGSLSNILQGITNGSIDFSSMSNEQRRDSILKLVNDPQGLQYFQQFQQFQQFQNQQQKLEKPVGTQLKMDPTALRQDMFNKQLMDMKGDTLKPEGPLSPTSSLSSKSEPKFNTDLTVHSPVNSSKNSSKNNSTINQVNLDQSQPYSTQRYYNYSQNPANLQFNNFVNPQQFPPSQVTNASPPFQTYQQLPPQNYRVNQNLPQTYPNYNISQTGLQVLPPNHTVVKQNVDKDKQEPSEDRKRFKKQKNQSGKKIINGDLLNLPPPIQTKEGEKPILGATKIDQLMLVLQARDENNHDVKYRTTKDGTIIGDIEPEHLVGGIEKQKLEEDETFEDDGDDSRKKKKRKIPRCPYCQKYFAQSTQLEVHIRSHIGYKPFECSYCHKRFTQGGNLTTHLRLHTGEKPFTCEICSRSFSRKGNLAAHKLTHDNLKPFDCKLDNCDKSFTQLGNLKSHQNKFHLDTLNAITKKLTELSAVEISQLPKHEQDLLDYFKDLYKNSNKGIKGRGKSTKSGESQSPPSRMAENIEGYNSVYLNNYDLNYLG